MLTAVSSHQALRDAATRVTVDPQANSVFEYATELFQGLESGACNLSDLAGLVHEVGFDLISQRAVQFRKQHSDCDTAAAWADIDHRLEALAADGWDVFQRTLEADFGGIVFTAHPTFALPKSVRGAFAAHISGPDADTAEQLKTAQQSDARDWSNSITLQGEHAEVQSAITEARRALEVYSRHVLSAARKHFPEQWHALRLTPPSIASWVGYDLDGRSDIHWSQSFGFRLHEKTLQLRNYQARLQSLSDHTGAPASLTELAGKLARAADLSEQEATLFAGDLTQSDTLLAAANALTSDTPDRITNSAIISQAIETILETLESPDLRLELMALRAEVDTLHLGTARIHLRLNAAQIRTVISRDLGLETEDRDLGRRALNALSKKAAASDTLDVNFADLFLERSTARRQFMMCAQFLKHIDAGSRIRFLIAESENPATVMGALYLARQYGVDASLDISPLFETPEALETGGRFIARLLDEPEFLSYVRTRGYLSVQLGFSDAGRFIGQVSADMAIERIHNLISRALAAKDPSLDLLIFNTHGESMGRGAWPGSFEQRFDHLLSQWTRQNNRQRGIVLKHEVSFQGGDGFLHFATPELAETTYAAYSLHLLSEPEAASVEDPFYSQTDLVWDFYRSLRQWHERLFADGDYAHLLSDFATNFLVTAGSRPRRRTSGAGGPRSLRAISHNATLQQLGVPLNTTAGIGSALRRESDSLVELINQSPRMRGLIMLGLKARMMTSVPALRAYATVYDPSFWVALAQFGNAEQATGYRRIYYRLQHRNTSGAILKIANRLSIDLGKFDRLLARLDSAPGIEERHEGRLNIHTLHAVRLALMMQAFSLIGQVPNVSTRHNTSIEDIFDMVLDMRLKEAVDLLCQIFPVASAPDPQLRQIEEPGHLVADSEQGGYDELHRTVIGPLDEIDKTLHAVTLAIAHAYGAFG